MRRNQHTQQSVNLEKFFNLSSDLLATTDLSGYFIAINKAFKNVLGWSNEELLNYAFWELAHPDDRSVIRKSLKNLGLGHPVIFIESNIARKTGDYLQIRWMAYPDTSSQLVYLVAQTTNLSDAISIDDDNFKLALEIAPTALLIIQDDGTVLYANHLAEKMFQYENGDLIGQSVEILVPNQLRENHIRHRGSYVQDPYLRPMGSGLDFTGERKNGKVIHINIGLNPIRTIKGLMVVCSIIDISSRKKHETNVINTVKKLKKEVIKLNKLASKDELTGLYNRRMYLKHIEYQIFLAHKDQSPMSLLLIDIDNFKSFNDQFGHLAGDKVLETIGKILQNQIRREDFAARHGGEEFAVVMPGTDEEQAIIVADRIRSEIEQYKWATRPITISAGIATIHPHVVKSPSPDKISQTILMADEAMYYSKKHGKNRSTHFNSIKEN